MAGFSQGGGVGLALSQWMVDGDPGADVWGMDVARYGDWATLAYTNAKVRENYSRRFSIRFPNEELPAARPLRTTPIYEKLQAEHAVFGDYCGSSIRCGSRRRRPRRSTTSASAARTRIRTSRPNAARRARRVGLLEISNYGKFEVEGRRGRVAVAVMANRVPAGRAASR
jgi:dimethylglycine dehydrogenase